MLSARVRSESLHMDAMPVVEFFAFYGLLLYHLVNTPDALVSVPSLHSNAHKLIPIHQSQHQTPLITPLSHLI